MPATQASTKYIVNIVLFLTPRSLLFYCTYLEIYLVIDLLKGHLKP